MTSLSALIAQVEALATKSLRTSWETDELADAAPVLAAALKDALETLREIIDLEPPQIVSGRAYSETRVLAEEFLERHKEETQ